MGEAERYGEYKKVKRRFTLGQDGNALTALFTLNVVFFILLLTIQVVYAFMQQAPAFNTQALKWFELPAQWDTFISRPWTILTYMFSDTTSNIFRVISNMLWLWAFGYIFQQATGNRQLIPVYIYGGVLGGIVYIITMNVVPSLNPASAGATMLGANAAIMSVAMAATLINPGHRFFSHIRGGIPIWIVMGIFAFINLAGIGKQNMAYGLSLAAGALAGFLFVYFLKRGTDLSNWMNHFYSRTMNLFNPNKRKPRTVATREKIFYNTGNRKPFSKSSVVTQQKVDEILDKINQRGYNYLTEEEKSILKKAAEEDL